MDTSNSENKAGSSVRKAKTIILCGTSRFPKNAIDKQAFGGFNLEVEVEPVNSKIINFSCTRCLFLGQNILQESLVGYEVEEGIKKATEEIDARLFSNTKKAVIAALRDLSVKYNEYKKSISPTV